MSRPADAVVTVGRIGRPHGVRGATTVEPWTDDPDERFAEGTVLLTDPAERGPLAVLGSTYAGGRLVVQFDGVVGREGAEALRGTQLLARAGDRPVLADPDDFYDTDLIGLAVRTVGGRDLGPVNDVLHAGGADYLVVHVEGVERLIPFVRAIVPVVDLAAGTVSVDPPEGLFEL